MSDNWLLQSILSTVGWTYLTLFVIAAALALMLPKRKRAKAFALMTVLALAALLPVASYQNYAIEVVANAVQRSRLDKAQAQFDLKCKSSGEKIYRTVVGVDGVLLMSERKESDKSSQFELTDPAGDDAHDSGYIETFFMGKQGGFVLTDRNRIDAYRFVEVVPSGGTEFLRYSDIRTDPSVDPLVKSPLKREVVAVPAAKYGVLTQDLSTPDDRANWIASSRIQVIDMASKEVLAERIGYIFDRGLGSTVGGRLPWAFAAANACPSFPKLHGQYPYKWGLTRLFVEKVLRPSKGV